MSKGCYDKDTHLTSALGVPIANDDSSLTVGERGPVLLQDIHQIEKLAHFDRERIPERVVHAKGAGAHGYFKLHNCMREHTKARLFTDTKCETQVFVRFSTVVGFRGSADTARDPRGFAVKFYTEEGNYDLVGNHLPVFFIRDSIKFPDMVHSFKPSPDTNITDLNRFWDFIGNSPESTHMIVFVYSDKGTIKSFRTIPGFGVNTYVWVNNGGKRTFVKYHWKPLAGEEYITREEAIRLAGEDPDVAVRDLYDTLSKGEKVQYELYVQLMDPRNEMEECFDPLDATKTWPEDRYPLKFVGTLTLTDGPNNFFEESEQAAFCPANLIPGIEASADKLLQGRLFSYSDTQRHRIGTNFAQLPINRAKVMVNNNERDGAMAYMPHYGKVNYSPNSLDHGRPKAAPEEYGQSEFFVEGVVARKVIHKTDNFTQAGELYESYTCEEKDHLVHNLACDLKGIERNIQRKVIENLSQASRELGERVEEAVKEKEQY